MIDLRRIVVVFFLSSGVLLFLVFVCVSTLLFSQLQLKLKSWNTQLITISPQNIWRNKSIGFMNNGISHLDGSFDGTFRPYDNFRLGFSVLVLDRFFFAYQTTKETTFCFLFESTNGNFSTHCDKGTKFECRKTFWGLVEKIEESMKLVSE